MQQFKNFKELLKYFSDDNKCREYLEEQRWHGTPICPHCGNRGAYKLKDGKTYKCKNRECYKKFTVTVGTIYENGKLPLSTWFAAVYIVTAHKKGISSYQLARDLGVTQKTAWFMEHRIREMVREKNPTILNNNVEADESYFGGKIKNKHAWQRKLIDNKTSPSIKTAVFAMIERNGKAFTKVVPDVKRETVLPILATNITKDAVLITDSSHLYTPMAEHNEHHVINHEQGEYAKGEYNTNTVEGFFSLLKRGIYGIYHQTSSKHLQRYCDEFAYRYNTRKLPDNERFILSLQNSNGRLKYKDLIKKTGNEKAKEIQ
jgi:transposase-like protein